MNEERAGSGYDKWNISVVICDTDIPYIILKTVLSFDTRQKKIVKIYW